MKRGQPVAVGRRFSWLVALASVVVAVGCGRGVVDCGACPQPLWLQLTVPAQAAAGPQASFPAGTLARVCIEGLPCTNMPVGDGFELPDLPDGVAPADLDGREVRVSIDAAYGTPAWYGTARFVHSGGHGRCGCPMTGATVVLTH